MSDAHGTGGRCLYDTLWVLCRTLAVSVLGFRVRFAEPLDLDELPGRVSAALPEGIDVTGAVPLVDRAPALQESVTAVEWEIELAGADAAALSDRIDAVLAAAELPVIRNRKGRADTVDIRPGIRHLAVLRPGEVGTVLHAEVATQPGVRPAELVAVVLLSALTAFLGIEVSRFYSDVFLVLLVVVIFALQNYFVAELGSAVETRVLSARPVEVRDLRALEAWRLSHYEYTTPEKKEVRLPLERARELVLSEAKAGKTFYPAKPSTPKPEAPPAEKAAK